MRESDTRLPGRRGTACGPAQRSRLIALLFSSESQVTCAYILYDEVHARTLGQVALRDRPQVSAADLAHIDAVMVDTLEGEVAQLLLFVV